MSQKKESIDKALDNAIKRFKRIDIVVNNAGYGLSGPFETLSEEQLRKQMEVNFFGLLSVTRKALETMRGLRTGGVIQQVTSIGGQVGDYIWLIQKQNKLTNQVYLPSLSTAHPSGQSKGSQRHYRRKLSQSGASS